MAKITGYFGACGELLEKFKLVARFKSNPFGESMQIAAPIAGPTEATKEAMRVVYTSAALGWNDLSQWKRIRWSMCAFSLYGSPCAGAGADGGSGYALYMKMRLEQETPPGKQPISPCSARATDPAANPHNYQP